MDIAHRLLEDDLFERLPGELADRCRYIAAMYNLGDYNSFDIFTYSHRFSYDELSLLFDYCDNLQPYFIHRMMTKWDGVVKIIENPNSHLVNSAQKYLPHN